MGGEVPPLPDGWSQRWFHDWTAIYAFYEVFTTDAALQNIPESLYVFLGVVRLV